MPSDVHHRVDTTPTAVSQHLTDCHRQDSERLGNGHGGRVEADLVCTGDDCQNQPVESKGHKKQHVTEHR